MLANPTGSARVSGPSRLHGQGTVEYLLDVCAPCQDPAASYAVNGVALSDFCTRGFFAASGAASSFTGAVRQGFEPIAHGVVTWLADDGLLFQARADGLGRVRFHGGFSPANRGRMLFREPVDILTPDRLQRLSNAPRPAQLLEAEQDARRVHLSSTIRFREDIAWRFGKAAQEAGGGEASRKARPANGYASTPLVTSQDVTEDWGMKVRSAS
jgi:hypothetical protein